MLHELIYTSIESRPMADEDLFAMLEEARLKNQRLGITGLLFYHDQEFVQILEGEKEVIFDLFNRITIDDRHRGVILFWDAPIKARSFENWSMGFATDDVARQLETSAYSSFLKDGLSGLNLTEHPNEGHYLMLELRNLMLKNEARKSA